MSETLLRVDVGDRRENAFEVHIKPDEQNLTINLTADEGTKLVESFLKDFSGLPHPSEIQEKGETAEAE
jgi:hypothetical protein